MTMPQCLALRHVRSISGLCALGAAAALTIVLTGCPAFLASAPPGGGTVDDNENRDVDLSRAIDEADIVKYDDGFFYISNPFTGLRIIDAQDMTRPTLAGGASLQGRAVELLVRDDLAYIVTAADFLTCAGKPIGFDEEEFDAIIAPDWPGSRLYILDTTDKQSILLRRTRGFAGFATATRLVGDVIYIAGYTTHDATPSGNKSGAFITSINVADPDAAEIIVREDFTGGAIDVLVTPTTIYVVGDDPDVPGTTVVTYIDISDPAGAIAIRDQFRVPGQVNNRFFFDEYAGVFRIVTGELTFYNYSDGDSYSYAKSASLFTYDVSDPDNVTRLARLAIDSREEVRAVRFDGDRAFVATSNYEDPLFVVDVSDPSNPEITGRLDSPGSNAHFVPAGNKLIGVGLTYSNGRRPTVTLYDVTPGRAPKVDDIVVLGERWDWDADTEALVDHKALRVIDQADLILLPFSTFDDKEGAYVDSLQLIQWEGNKLRERGLAEHLGLVRRANMVDGYVWVLSDQAFQTIDIDDMNKPASLKNIELISDQDLLDAGLSKCADSARLRGEDVYYGDYYGYGLCGYATIMPLLALLATLTGMKLSRRR